ncbi:MAG: fumarylacetoacetate hydrolase family protein [Lacipirellulaceae bacterium]
MRRSLATFAVLALSLVAPERGVADRWLRFEHNGAATYGVVEQDGFVAVVEGEPWESPTKTGERVALSSVKPLVPTEPTNVLGGAFNFRSHLGERTAPTKPEFFWKPASCLIATGEAIALPSDATDAHYEAELVIVIGRRVEHATETEAAAAIFGYTCGNDVTERTWAKTDVQWWRAKATRTFGTVGPEIVTGLDWSKLRVQGVHNDRVAQDEAASDLLFSPAQIVAFASRYVTLLPGDLIYTGSPGATQPLRAGDTFEVRIEGVGSLVNPVVTAAE